MALGRLFRPVWIGLLGLTTAACGFVESDPQRFENLARAVAEIPLDDQAPVRTASSGLRPAFVTPDQVADPGALRVEVLDPHALWDARDAGLRGAVEGAAAPAVEAAAPVLVRAAVQPASRDAGDARTSPVRETLQLGAFSSPDAARQAWSRIAAAGETVSALTPAFEAVEVDGRTLTRLKVAAPIDAARAVCRAADAAGLGCLRRG